MRATESNDSSKKKGIRRTQPSLFTFIVSKRSRCESNVIKIFSLILLFFSVPQLFYAKGDSFIIASQHGKSRLQPIVLLGGRCREEEKKLENHTFYINEQTPYNCD